MSGFITVKGQCDVCQSYGQAKIKVNATVAYCPYGCGGIIWKKKTKVTTHGRYGKSTSSHSQSSHFGGGYTNTKTSQSFSSGGMKVKSTSYSVPNLIQFDMSNLGFTQTIPVSRCQSKHSTIHDNMITSCQDGKLRCEKCRQAWFEWWLTTPNGKMWYHNKMLTTQPSFIYTPWF